MAEDRGGSRGRKGRRRYFQPKRDSSGQPQAGQPNQQANQARGGGQRPPDNKSTGQKARRARKRARSRQRFDDRVVNLEAEVAYVAPQAVYIYEHSAHPELRDTYEFRPEHFSSVGRTLDDYQLDLSKLFGGAVATDGTPVMTNLLPPPEFDWTGWEEEDRSRDAPAVPAAPADAPQVDAPPAVALDPESQPTDTPPSTEDA